MTGPWTAGSAWGDYGFDAGIYRGPWPAYPPTFFPADATEVHFVVAAPNPDGIADHVADGSYPTDLLDARRFSSTPDDIVLNFGSSGGGPNTPAVVPAGAHLFVFWRGAAIPSIPPTALIPKVWGMGGTGPGGDVAHGHWSEWQVSDPRQQGAVGPLGDGSFGVLYQHAIDSGEDGGVDGVSDVLALQDGHLVAARATPPGMGVGGTGTEGQIAEAFVIFDGLHNGVTFSYGKVELRAAWATYALFGDSNFGANPIPAGFVDGIDYAQPPAVAYDRDSVPAVEYEAEESTFAGIVWTCDFWTDTHSVNNGAGPSTFPLEYSDATFHIYLADVADYPRWFGPPFPSAPPWPPNPAGIPVGSITVSQPTASTHVTVNLATGTRPPETFVALVVPDLLYSGGSAVSDWTPTPDVYDERIAQWSASITALAGGPVITWQPPRWRYWIPALSTVAPYLRMTQRNDGRGVSRHPRLVAAQSAHAPRVGGKNTYQ